MFPDQTERKREKSDHIPVIASAFVSLSIATRNCKYMNKLGDGKSNTATVMFHCVCAHISMCSAEWCFCCWLMNLLKPVAWQWEKLEKCNILCDGAAYIFRFSFYFSWWWLYDLYKTFAAKHMHTSNRIFPIARYIFSLHSVHKFGYSFGTIYQLK